nr:uncharacterized protein LOC109423406 isoform X2 [Aedes albopictus]XP_029728253.1 uncharacterized protein LOC109418354 isoform X2 [Aedes albopictus]
MATLSGEGSAASGGPSVFPQQEADNKKYRVRSELAAMDCLKVGETRRYSGGLEVDQQKKTALDQQTKIGVYYEPFVGQRGVKKAITVNGYIFHLDKSVGEKKFYKCADTPGCRARFKISGQTGTYTNANHSHPDHSVTIAKAELRSALKEASTRSFEGYRAIFDAVCNLPEHRDAASKLSYSEVQHMMRKARSTCFPPVPSTVSEFSEIMTSDKAAGFRSIDGDPFYYGSTGEAGNQTMFFIVPATKNALRVAAETTLSFDGTFKTKPAMFGQLFMAYAKVNEKIHPLAFMPAENEHPTTEQYKNILQRVKAELGTVKVTVTVSDFEKPLINACREVFSQATHQGCLFHFKQAVKRYIVVKVGVHPTSKDYNVYRMALQLPHLPANKMMEGVKVVTEYIKKHTEDVEKAEDFGRYLRLQWLRNISPLIYSTYRSDITTNNVAESYHSLLLREVGVSPSPWVFVEKIIGLSKTVALEISRGDQALMYRRQQSERQKVVQLCTAAFDEDGDVQKFLLSLNDSKKNIECCSMQMADNDLIIALDAEEDGLDETVDNSEDNRLKSLK